MGNLITVGIADLNIARNEESLVTYALGSCVGICLYDSALKVAGLAHIMLPFSGEMNRVAVQPYKFADTGIEELLKKMTAAGANPLRMTAKIAGGAQMFAAMSSTAIAKIGERNVTAVKTVLAQKRIPLLAADTGADYGRTLYFYAQDGSVVIKSAKCGEHRL